MTDVRLDDDQLDQLADRVAARLATMQPTGLVDAATLARHLAVDRSYVYTHSVELGGVRLGGPRGRLRFDVERARAAFTNPAPEQAPPTPRPRRRTRASTAHVGSILKVRR